MGGGAHFGPPPQGSGTLKKSRQKGVNISKRKERIGYWSFGSSIISVLTNKNAVVMGYFRALFEPVSGKIHRRLWMVFR